MANTVPAHAHGTVEPVMVGTATLGVALIGYLVAPQLDELMFVAAAVTVAAIVGLGATLLARGAPDLAAFGPGYAASAWIAPVAWYLAALVSVRLLALDGLWLAAGGATAALGALLIAQQRELRLPVGGHRAAEFVVNLGVFVSAFALFAVPRELQLTGLLGALLAALVAGILALVPLRRGLAGAARTLLYAILVAAAVGQFAWALGFWALPPLVAGAVLLLVFYVLVGLCESILDRTFSRRILVEYSVVGVCGVALILGVGPWRA